MFDTARSRSAPLEILARQGPVDSEGGARALRGRHDRQLHVANDVAGHEYAGHAGRFIRAAQHTTVPRETATQDRARSDWARDGVSKNRASRVQPGAVAKFHRAQTPAGSSESRDPLCDDADPVALEPALLIRAETSPGRRCSSTMSRAHAVNARAIWKPRCPRPYTATLRSRISQPSQYGHWNTLRPNNSSIPGRRGSRSNNPVAMSSLRARTRREAPSVTMKPFLAGRARVTSTGANRTPGYRSTSRRAISRNRAGATPSRVDRRASPWTPSCAGYRCRTSSTRRRARPRTSAAEHPAGPAPAITTSQILHARYIAEACSMRYVPLKCRPAAKGPVGALGQ